jgi:GT2 family glycosyltransferase
MPGFSQLPWTRRARVHLLGWLQSTVNRHATLVGGLAALLPGFVASRLRASSAPLRVRRESASVDPASVPTSSVLPSAESPAASIVIPTYRAFAWLEACLACVAAHTDDVAVEVIVVDDGSPSPERVATMTEKHPGVRLVRSERNSGFAAAVNRGAREARADVLVVLNDDVLVSPGWLSTLIAVLASDERIAWVGPASNDTGDAATVPAHYQSFAGFLARAEGRSGSSRDVDKLALFCAVLRRRAFDAVGGLDESYGLGMFEDDDLAQRFRQRGQRVVLCEGVFVHHAAGATLRSLDPLAYFAQFELNRRRFEQRWGVRWRPRGG